MATDESEMNSDESEMNSDESEMNSDESEMISESVLSVQRWVSPNSTDEIWSNIREPIGAILGCRRTCVDYHFVPITNVAWQKGLQIRLVMLSEPDEMPNSQIAYLEAQEFMNESVCVTAVDHSTIEGVNGDGDVFRWNKDTLVLQQAPEQHAIMVGSSLGGVYHEEFTFTVNNAFTVPWPEVKAMLKANADAASKVRAK